MPAEHRAARIHSLGETPQVDNVDPPRRLPGQTLVSVAGAAVNPADLLMARGYYPGQLPPLPFVVGLEGAGRVLDSDVHAAGTQFGGRPQALPQPTRSSRTSASCPFPRRRTSPSWPVLASPASPR